MIYLGIGLAGGLGAILRYLIGRLFVNAGWLSFPYSTLLVNIVGSFLIGFMILVLQDKWGLSENLKIMVVTGFLGGFTTFSAFSLDAVIMLEQGEFLKGLFYIGFTVVLCLCACGLGLVAARNI